MAAITPQIGSDSRGQFLWVRGAAKPLQQALVDISRNGINGTAFQKTGTRGEAFSVQSCVGLSSAGGVADRLAYYTTLVGTLVSFKDGEGTTWTNILVRGVDQTNSQPIVSGVGGTANTMPSGTKYLLYATWQLQATLATTKS